MNSLFPDEFLGGNWGGVQGLLADQTVPQNTNGVLAAMGNSQPVQTFPSRQPPVINQAPSMMPVTQPSINIKPLPVDYKAIYQQAAKKAAEILPKPEAPGVSLGPLGNLSFSHSAAKYEYEVRQWKQQSKALTQKIAMDLMRVHHLARSGFNNQQQAQIMASPNPSGLIRDFSNPYGNALVPVKTPKGVRYMTRAEAHGQAVPQQQGMQLTTNPDGTVTFSNGAVPSPLTKPNANKVQDKAFNATEYLARLNAIEKSYKPEYQRYQDRFAFGWDSIKDKLGADLSKRDKAELAGFTTFKRRAIENLNLTIKEITGAAMTNAESERISKQVPYAGTGLFDGDSPTEFGAKLNDSLGSVRAALRRYHYAMNKGVDWRSITLNQMDQIIEERGKELTKHYMDKGMDEETAWATALEDLRKEFGL